MSSISESVLSCLLHRRLVSTEQLYEARLLCERTGIPVADALVRLGYATSQQILSTCAEVLGLTYLDLADLDIPLDLIELVPESVARENVILPVARGEGLALVVAMRDPCDF